MKTITMYELLGLVKDGKAPKYIKHCGAVYTSLYFESRNSIDYEDVKSGDLLFADRIIINERLNDEVEILEEEKKIPEETTVSEEQMLFNNLTTIDQEYVIRFMKMLQPPIIDYLKSKGE